MNIQHFCGQNEIREWLRQPFQLGNRTIATNGHVMLSLPKEGKHPECPEKAAVYILGMFSVAGTLDYVPMPEVIFPEKSKCETCNGGGKATVTDCSECLGEGCATCSGSGVEADVGGDLDCPFCYGKGEKFKDWTPVEIFDIHIDANYLALITEPGVVVASEGDKLYFKSGDQIGIIMEILPK